MIMGLMGSGSARRERTDGALREFGERLGYRFSSLDGLKEALTHASYANESGTGSCNERLEFLGDAVLELCVSEELFMSRPDYDEGELTKSRARVVCASSLASWASKVRISPLLLLSKGLEIQGGRRNQSILADAMEAVLGAIFLDGGYKAASSVIKRFMAMSSFDASAEERGKDAKTRLQEAFQAMGLPPPSYRLLSRSGPEHASTFEVEAVLMDGRVFAAGSGCSKKSAEFAAAEVGLRRLEDESNWADAE
jgi:ribonuclease-3